MFYVIYMMLDDNFLVLCVSNLDVKLSVELFGRTPLVEEIYISMTIPVNNGQ